ncbi:hypothetical protein GCM10009654_65050 [Streptomyces hebeiensis]|uniref:Uncharacterized protein n=1 Tax=Streptomyces hebeiensis TaxID=229486 RepID=A0ABN1V868_9ACTN
MPGAPGVPEAVWPGPSARAVGSGSGDIGASRPVAADRAILTGRDEPVPLRSAPFRSAPFRAWRAVRVGCGGPSVREHRTGAPYGRWASLRANTIRGTSSGSEALSRHSSI